MLEELNNTSNMFKGCDKLISIKVKYKFYKLNKINLIKNDDKEEIEEEKIDLNCYRNSNYFDSQESDISSRHKN